MMFPGIPISILRLARNCPVIAARVEFQRASRRGFGSFLLAAEVCRQRRLSTAFVLWRFVVRHLVFTEFGLYLEQTFYAERRTGRSQSLIFFGEAV